MKICDCKCGNCDNDDHKHCEHSCDEYSRKEALEEALEQGYIDSACGYEG
jgi:hypothetical protein